MFFQLLATAVMSSGVQVGPRPNPLGVKAAVVQPTDDTTKRRPHSIEYSDAYYTRLRIHRIASYAELPLFATEYVLGERLITESRTGFPSGGLKTAHTTVALGLGALFTVNTVTGAWNLWDSRHDPAGRTLRLVHSIAMLGADAGFAWAGATGPGADASTSAINHHRTIALSSIGVATAGTLMMWLFHD